MDKRKSETPESGGPAAAILGWASRIAAALSATLVPSETKFLAALAVVIGLCTGLFAFVFDRLIHAIITGGLGGDPVRMSELPLWSRWRILLYPALGGLVVGPLIHHFCPESKGEGVPNVMKAIHKQGGRMRGRVAVMKAVFSALTIGTGGSAGREGPIVQIGAAIGSRLAQVFKLSSVTLRTMAAAGSAAGIAAAFNAPLGGMAFSMEVILGEISSGPFAMVVLSTVVASAVSRILHGSASYFTIPQYRMGHWSELVLYVVLGAAVGVAAKAFQKLFYRIEDEFERFRSVPPQWRPAVGGFLTGALGFFLPGVIGPGYTAVDSALRGGFGPLMVLLLLGGKMLATSFTLGSGGSGGTLMPSLFMGGMLGSLLGQAFSRFFPGLVDPGAYAMVGMAAFLGALVRAPLTGILILFEMTNDYQMILPLMAATVTATLVAHVIEPESIYTLKLVRDGINLKELEKSDPLARTTVSEVMTKKVQKIRDDYPIGKLGRHFNKTGLTGFPVVDQNGKLVGMLTISETQAAYLSEPPPPADTPIGRIMRSFGVPLFPDDTASEALRRISSDGLDRLPVVARDAPDRIVGIVSKTDLIRLYAKRVA